MSSWWDKKLSGGAAPQPQPQGQPVYPQTQQPAQPMQRMQTVPQGYAPGYVEEEIDPNAEVSMADLLRRTPREIPKKARATREERTECPECGSGNVFTGVAHETGRKKPHCYDCGWPLLQSGSGMAAVSGKVPHLGPARTANTPPPPPEPGYPAPKGVVAF